MIYVINGLRTSDMLMIYANIIGLNYKGKRFFTSGKNYFERSVYWDLGNPDELCEEFHDFLMRKNIIVTDHRINDIDLKQSNVFANYRKDNGKILLIDKSKDYLIGPRLSDKLIAKLKSLVGSTNVRVLNFEMPLSKLYAKFKKEDYFTSVEKYELTSNGFSLHDRLAMMVVDQLNVKNSTYPKFKAEGKFTIELNDKKIDLLPEWYTYEEESSGEIKIIEDLVNGL